MSVFLYKGQNIEYKVVKMKRKTIGIKISFEEGVVISVPLRCSQNTIKEVLNSRGDWILSKVGLLAQQGKDIIRRRYKSGETLIVLGEQYILNVIQGKIRGCKAGFDGKEFTVSVDETLDEEERKVIIEQTLNKLFRDIARKYFTERTMYYSNILNLYPERIAIKEQKSVWGSCSSKNNINYNWKIVMAPFEILDYIVVHELCHLKHRNHSKEYWNMVESILPDHEKRRAWLKENGKFLGLDYIKTKNKRYCHV